MPITITNFNRKNKQFNCSKKKLISLPALSTIMNIHNLRYFNCSKNELTSLHDNMNFPNLQILYCNHNHNLF